MRSPTTLSQTALLALALLAAAPAAHAAKESGMADHASVDLTILDATSATLKLTQTWEGARAAAMSQSLDAYFGNGDGRLAGDEIAKVTAAASHDLLNQSYPGFLVDAQPSRVTAASVTMDGADANDTTTPLALHHDVTLALSEGSDEHHSLVITPLWNGTYTFTLPSGQAFAGGSGTQTGALHAGAQVSVSFGPPQAAPQNATNETQSVVSAPPVSSTPPQEASGAPPSPPRSIPGAPLAALVAILGGVALLARKRR